ncbi:MAG TPA: glycosyltransferase [Thermoanaerobaculia bacterium]
MKVVAVIAAWNERENIEALTRRLHDSLRAIPDSTFEILYVIEGNDGTREIAERLRTELGNIRILYEQHPHGLGAAFRRGFSSVAHDADLVVTMDADLNHQPEEIPRLIDALHAAEADIVIGSRAVIGSTVTGTPAWKRALSATLNTIMHALFGAGIRDKTSGFRIYRANVLRDLPHRQNDFSFLPEIAIRAQQAGCRIIEEPIHFIYRRDGKSKMRFLPTSLSYIALMRMWWKDRRR